MTYGRNEGKRGGIAFACAAIRNIFYRDRACDFGIIAGVSSKILLAGSGFIALAVWKKRKLKRAANPK